MTVRIRFFAQFGELFGTESIADGVAGQTFTDLIKTVAAKNREGFNAIFDEHGAFREFVILMKNGKRIENADAAVTTVADGDEIAVFPPVAGG